MSGFANKFNNESIAALSNLLAKSNLTNVLQWAFDSFGAQAAIGTSFQGSGLVMIDHAVKANIPLSVFTIDTNLLFPETLQLKERLENHWGIQIDTLQPLTTLTEQQEMLGNELWEHKPNTCCTIRKVEPLQAKLKQLSMWITGIRRDQSSARSNAQMLEMYMYNHLMEQSILKLNPMILWSREQVWLYIKENKIPYNVLHDKGYSSIGCWPCTQSVKLGDNERAGRWTGFDKTECGIHTFLGEGI